MRIGGSIARFRRQCVSSPSNLGEVYVPYWSFPQREFVVASGERLGYLAMAVEIIEQLGAPPLNFSVRHVH